MKRRTTKLSEGKINRIVKESVLNKIVKESVKKILRESVSPESVKKWAEESEQWLRQSDGTSYYKLGESDCETGEMYLVMGWNDGFEVDNTENPNADGTYRICIKLAYNCDDLQSDYNFDWEMPHNNETGDVDDTDMEYNGVEDAECLLNYWIKNYKI